MRLYHSPGSRSSRVLWTLEEIGCPYQVTIMTRDQRRGEEHRGRHPLGRVPVLELDDGQLLFESAAICLQLADLYPEAGLNAPLGSTARGRVYQWTAFAIAEIEPALRAWRTAHRDGSDETVQADAFREIASAIGASLAQHPWIAGDSFSVADVLCATMLGGAASLDLLTEHDTVADYAKRALARPASQRADAVTA